jgi:hypothetical protein
MCCLLWGRAYFVFHWHRSIAYGQVSCRIMYCGHGNHFLGTEVVTAMSIKTVVLWGVIPCCLMGGYTGFRGTCADSYEGPFKACFPLSPCPPPSFLRIPPPCSCASYFLAILQTGLFRPKPPFPILWTVLSSLAHFYPENAGSRSHWDIGTFLPHHHIPEDPSLNNHHCKNLRSCMDIFNESQNLMYVVWCLILRSSVPQHGGFSYHIYISLCMPAVCFCFLISVPMDSGDGHRHVLRKCCHSIR